VTGLDATVILERPKLAPHIDVMRAAIAHTLGLRETSVSVKAKTNEGVDAVGRGEAIAAHAVATLVHTIDERATSAISRPARRGTSMSATPHRVLQLVAGARSGWHAHPPH
jgi:hypothetical protein